MRVVSVRAAQADAEPIVGEVRRTFADCLTLADLLAWAARQAPRVVVSEIVTQDEFTHDVVLPFASVFLSFDTN